MFGKVSDRTELEAPAGKAWEIYGTLELGRLAEKELPNVFERIEEVEGDGGEGTILNIVFTPGGPPSFKEKFTKVDHENRIIETEVIEGGQLDLGFTLYRIQLQIIEKDDDRCIVESTIEYELKEEATANASLVNIEPYIEVAQVVNNYFINCKRLKMMA